MSYLVSQPQFAYDILHSVYLRWNKYLSYVMKILNYYIPKSSVGGKKSAMKGNKIHQFT